MYRFPKDLYADVRMIEKYSLAIRIQNGEVEQDSVLSNMGALVRVYDGTMWYTASTDNVKEIQQELDNLASVATPNAEIYENPIVKKFQVNRDKICCFDEEKDLRKVTRKQWMELLDKYAAICTREEISEISAWHAGVACNYVRKSFYSCKGAEIIQDSQQCMLGVGFDFNVNGIPSCGGKIYNKYFMEELLNHEEEIIQERDRCLHFARNAVQLEPGEYTCVLAPNATAMFVHESFGHKSEADFVLNDKTLQEEWTMGKKVGSEKVSICDRGDLQKHGYTPYDDEGTKAEGIWLMKKGVLTGRLHDANSAAILGEELTGNARAQGYSNTPLVQMTNTFMEAGDDDPQEMIKGVKDGIYIYDVKYGTGQATFTIKPGIAYRIRNGEICEPVRINVLTGSVFQALFDIDAVGTDYELFDTYTCGKGGQTVDVSAGGPSIRVKKLTVN